MSKADKNSDPALATIVTLFVSVWTVVDLVLKLSDKISAHRNVIFGLGLPRDATPVSQARKLYILQESIREDMLMIVGILVVYGAALLILGWLLAKQTPAGYVLLGFGALLLLVATPASIVQSLRHYEHLYEHIISVK